MVSREGGRERMQCEEARSMGVSEKGEFSWKNRVRAGGKESEYGSGGTGTAVT